MHNYKRIHSKPIKVTPQASLTLEQNNYNHSSLDKMTSMIH